MEKFECRSTDNSGPDDWEKFNGSDVEDAVTRFARWYDRQSVEYPAEQSVTVKGHGVFIVDGESERVYSARKQP